MLNRRFITHLIRIITVVVGLLLTPMAAAADLIVSRAVLEDNTGSLSIADAIGLPFTPLQSVLSEGYSESAYWLRVQVRKPAKGSQVVLHIGPALLDEVRLYEPDEDEAKEWITRVTGDRYAYADRDRKDIALGFVVEVTKPEKTFYLRIKTTSASQITVEGLEPRQANHNAQRSDLIRNIFIGLMLWALIWAVDHYLVGRDAAVGLFALYQGAYILYGLGVTGNLAPFVPYDYPQLADWLSNIFACALPFTFLLFSRALLRHYAPPWLHGFTVLLWFFPLQLVAMALGYTLIALSVAALMSVTAAWYGVALAFAATRDQVPSRRFLQAVYVVIALIMTLFGLGDFGLMPLVGTGSKSGWGLIVGGVAGSALLCTVLYRRLRQLRRDAQQAQVHARIDSLTGLFNRRYFIELTEDELARATRNQTPLSLLMIDIDHFKVVNDTWGHHGGDIVLQHVALSIRRALRDVDILGRLGGEEFAAVLIGQNTDQALEVAERIRTAVDRTAIVLPGEQYVNISLSVGLTQLDKHGSSLSSLLHTADMALYQAKEAGRNQVRVAGEGVN